MTQPVLDTWGDALPSDVIAQEPGPVAGRRLPDGRIECGGCGSIGPDSDMPGLKPSCSFCWRAIDVNTEVNSHGEDSYGIA